jgi:16S rRNA (cytidine1402-2'-O)-methyltransferase
LENQFEETQPIKAGYNSGMGTLYLVATPIGNLEDLSPRAVRILREARLIAAEDTRHTRALLNHFDLHTPLTSYFEHNKLSKLDAILAALSLGDVALVSDAGTPAINDPGYELVKAALQAGYAVSPIPGPSAPVAALAASGLPTDSFLYLGYLPRKSGERRAFVEKVLDAPYTLIFFETPHRLLEALSDLEAVLGDRQISIARELTKLHEQFVRGRISEVRAHFTETAPRGEFVLVVAGAAQAESLLWSEATLLAAIHQKIEAGQKTREIAAELAALSGWNKKEIYTLASQRR